MSPLDLRCYQIYQKRLKLVRQQINFLLDIDDYASPFELDELFDEEDLLKRKMRRLVLEADYYDAY